MNSRKIMYKDELIPMDFPKGETKGDVPDKGIPSEKRVTIVLYILMVSGGSFIAGTGLSIGLGFYDKDYGELALIVFNACAISITTTCIGVFIGSKID